ncbi:MAG: energy-coupling factor ABC transporter permease [Nitrospirota bacterium]
MHAPDGFFSPAVNVVSGAVSLGVILYSFKKTFKNLEKYRVYMMAAVGAFIFAAQMLNFTVSAGTSGHFLGGVTAGIMLGPWAGTIVMTTVVVLQAIIFQDGGIIALGPNILNMGIWGTLIGYYIYASLKGTATNLKLGMYFGAFVASWVAVMLAAFFCSLQLAISGVLSLGELLPPMLSVHAKIGIGEGLISALFIFFLMLFEPQLVWHDVKFEEIKV